MIDRSKKTITVYDAGGLFLVWFFFGLPLGILFDYFWNFLVLSIALPRLPAGISSNPGTKSIGRGRKYAYCVFATVLGALIDWAYFELTWDVGLGRTQLWVPAMAMPFQFLLLLMPMIMLGLVNFALSYPFLKLERSQAIILGAVMGFFTAPWLLPTIPYIFGWVM